MVVSDVVLVPEAVLVSEVLGSTLAFLGMGSVLLGDWVGLVLVERFPLSRRFTSSSSVPESRNFINLLITDSLTARLISVQVAETHIWLEVKRSAVWL